MYITIVLVDFFRGFTFYKMANLDNRISNADQLLTQVHNAYYDMYSAMLHELNFLCYLLQDVEKFTETLGELYSNILKVCLKLFFWGHTAFSENTIYV